MQATSVLQSLDGTFGLGDLVAELRSA